MLLLLAVYVINLGYGFEGSFQRLGDFRFVSQTLAGPEADRGDDGAGNRFADSWLAGVPVPVPKNYLLGIDVQKVDFERKMPSYLRGEWRLGGWWYYYLYALLIKEPLGTWALALLAAGMAGYSIYVYHVTPEDARRVRRELDAVVSSPSPGEPGEACPCQCRFRCPGGRSPAPSFVRQARGQEKSTPRA